MHRLIECAKAELKVRYYLLVSQYVEKTFLNYFFQIPLNILKGGS